GQHMGTERRGTLGAGEHDADRVLLPLSSCRRIGDAAPQIDHGLAPHRQADRGADLAVGLEIMRECLGNPFEALLAGTFDLHCCGTGSFSTVTRKRAALLRPVWSMPWPMPGAM